jgi:hypothetical protein
MVFRSFEQAQQWWKIQAQAVVEVEVWVEAGVQAWAER